MKKFLYSIAKAIVENQDKKSQVKKEDQEAKRLKQMEEKKAHDKLIMGFKNRLISELSDEFKKTSSPKFSAGDIALTHWYGDGDSWDGSAQSLQSHTPFRGPIEVEITGVYLDSAEIAEFIDRQNDRDSFVAIDMEKEYPHFKGSVLKQLEEKDLELQWCYTIKVPGDENKYWNYTWRENKLLRPKSDEARWSKKAFKNEKEYKALREESEALREKIRKQVERVTGTHVIVR
jgi:hypothetical protein